MFGLVMRQGPSPTELERLADEARESRERLQELIRLAIELRTELDRQQTVEPGDTLRKLQSVS